MQAGKPIARRRIIRFLVLRHVCWQAQGYLKSMNAAAARQFVGSKRLPVNPVLDPRPFGAMIARYTVVLSASRKNGGPGNRRCMGGKLSW